MSEVSSPAPSPHHTQKHGWGLVRHKSIGQGSTFKARQRVADEAQVPRVEGSLKRPQAGKLRPVWYRWWGKRGTVKTPLPEQYGRPLNWRKSLELVMADVQAGGTKAADFVLQDDFQLLVEDMFWYLYLDEFALTDHKQKVRDYIASIKDPRSAWRQKGLSGGPGTSAADQSGSGDAATKMPAIGRGYAATRPVHLHDQKLIRRVERRVKAYQAIQDQHVGAGAGGRYAPGYTPATTTASVCSGSLRTPMMPLSLAGGSSASVSGASRASITASSRRKRRFTNTDRYPALPAVMVSVRPMNPEVAGALDEQAEGSAKLILRNAYRADESHEDAGECVEETLHDLLLSSRGSVGSVSARSSSAGSLTASHGWSLWDGPSDTTSSSSTTTDSDVSDMSEDKQPTATTSVMLPQASANRPPHVPPLLYAPEAAALVVEEKSHLFTRMSYHYVKLFRALSAGPGALRDTILAELPVILVKLIFLYLSRTMPYLRPHFDAAFRRNLSRRVTYWLCGVEIDSVDAQLSSRSAQRRQSARRTADRQRCRERQEMASTRSVQRRRSVQQAGVRPLTRLRPNAPMDLKRAELMSPGGELVPTPPPPAPTKQHRSVRSRMRPEADSAAQEPLAARPPTPSGQALLRMNRFAAAFQSQDNAELRQRIDSLRKAFSDIKDKKYRRPSTPIELPDPADADAPGGDNVPKPSTGPVIMGGSVPGPTAAGKAAPPAPSSYVPPQQKQNRAHKTLAQHQRAKARAGRAKVHTYDFKQAPWYEQGKAYAAVATKVQQSYFSLTNTSPLLAKFKNMVGAVDNPFREVEMKWAVAE